MDDSNDVSAQFRKDMDKVTDELKKAYETISKLKIENTFLFTANCNCQLSSILLPRSPVFYHQKYNDNKNDDIN